MPKIKNEINKNYSSELIQLAKKTIWFQEYEETLANRDQFLAYLMKNGRINDILIMYKYYSNLDLIHAFHSDFGRIIDYKAKAFWALRLDLELS